MFCAGCDDRLGWYYHKASDSSQKYKEGESTGILDLDRVIVDQTPGKYLLERERLVKDNQWKLD